MRALGSQIRCNVLSPGPVKTPISKNLYGDAYTGQFKEVMEETVFKNAMNCSDIWTQVETMLCAPMGIEISDVVSMNINSFGAF